MRPQKRFLYHVLCIVPIAQHAVSDLEHQPRMPANIRLQLNGLAGLFFQAFRALLRAANSGRIRHHGPLTGPLVPHAIPFSFARTDESAKLFEIIFER